MSTVKYKMLTIRKQSYNKQKKKKKPDEFALCVDRSGREKAGNVRIKRKYRAISLIN